MSGVKNGGSIRRRRVLFVVFALTGTVTAALAVTGLMSDKALKPVKEPLGVTEKAPVVSFLKQAFPDYQHYSEKIINGVELQTIYGQSHVLGYSAILFNAGCSTCRKEQLFVAASANDHKIVAVEIVGLRQAHDDRVNEFLRQFIGKVSGDDLVLGSGIQMDYESMNPSGAIAITDGISEFLRAVDEVDDQ